MRQREKSGARVRVDYNERTGKTRVLTGEAVDSYARDVPLRITYDVRVPREMRAIVAGYLPAVVPFIPTEYHELDVHWDVDDVKADATMSSQRSYRRCTLTICPIWLEGDEATRRRILLHEVAHTITAPLSLLCQRLIDVVAPEEDKEKEPTGPWSVAMDDADETVTQDLARHLMRLIPESAWPVHP